MLTLNDGRSELWQWDTGRKLTVDRNCTQVHFSNKLLGRSIDVDVSDGVAIIPDFLLQTDKDLTAWAFVGTPENGYTKISKVFKINRRNKPADYVFTPTDQTTLGEILDRIEELENRPGADISKEDIQNAVNDYLENNPIEIEETDPTVPQWAKQPEKPQYTAGEVGAQPSGDYALRNEIPSIPTALPNPNKLTLTGAVNAEYDGSEAVEVEIPEGGAEKQGMELLATVTTEEDTTSINISQCDDGTPFSDKKLTRIGVQAVIAGNSEVTTAGVLCIIAGQTHPMYGAMYIKNMISSLKREAFAEFRTLGKMIFGLGSYDDNNWFQSRTNINPSSGFSTINNVRFFPQDNSNLVIPAGSTFEIWGC